MFVKKLTIILLAAAMSISCLNSSRAEEAQPAQNEAGGGATAAAVVSDVLYIPGKTCSCVISSALWTGVMVVSFGVLYKEAGDFVHDVCSGKWVIRGEDMAGPRKEL